MSNIQRTLNIVNPRLEKLTSLQLQEETQKQEISILLHSKYSFTDTRLAFIHLLTV